jgi:DNA-binding transcriptional MerR regulator
MGEAESELLTIGELAERVGVATSALRYYEEVGLLEPTERRAGRRHYHRSAVEVVGTILLLRDVGFTITEIGQLYSSRADRAARRTLPRCKLEELSRKAAEIDVARQALEHGFNCPRPTSSRARTSPPSSTNASPPVSPGPSSSRKASRTAERGR